MAEFKFAPAVRLNTPMIIGISGASGSGKTFTALTLAMGLAGPEGKIAFIDTEGRRSLHYADLKGPDGKLLFAFDHCDMPAPYSPARFLDALTTAEKAGYAVIVVDSFSDEYVGAGGLVDMADAELARVKNSAAAWAKPKAQHKLVTRWLRQSRVHVIFCLRAEEKVRLEKVMRDGREQTVVVPIGWVPITEKNVPYEMGTSFMLTPDAPGVPKPIKLQEQHRSFFPLDKPVTRQTGIELAAWCAGGAPATPPAAEFDELTTTDVWAPEDPDDIPDFPYDDEEAQARTREVARRLAAGEKPAKIRAERAAQFTKRIEELAGEAAEKGYHALRTYCEALTPEERASIKKLVVEKLQPRARKVDADYDRAIHG